jgi:transposase
MSLGACIRTRLFGESVAPRKTRGRQPVIADDLGATPQIKQNPTRSGTRAIDWTLSKERNLVERIFTQINRFRRIALRCEMTVASFRGFVLPSAPWRGQTK